MRPFYWFTFTLLRGVFRLFYHHRIYGLEHHVTGKAIIAPNHTSFLDPPLIAASWDEEIAFLARKSLFKNWFLGGLIKKLNAYPVSGEAENLNSFKLISHLLQENKKVVIFPEGVRSRSGGLETIKSGIGVLALRNAAPIIPVYIDGCFEIWNRTRRFPKLRGKTACVIGSPIRWQSFVHLGKKQAQEAITRGIQESIGNLKRWYEEGAKGSPP